MSSEAGYSEAGYSEAGYDVVVVGGGLLGAGIARDAALRGLSVALFEAADYGAGADARGSRLALGGLSALGTLDFTQVRDDIREREILLQTVPHLVQPQACLIPFYSHGLLVQARLRAGLALSDALGFDHALRVHQLLSVKEARKRAPSLRPDGLLGAALVWEAAIPQIERLARELAFDARRHGAALHPYTRVEELCRTPIRQGRERVGGVIWKNRLSGEKGRTNGAVVILAAGSGQAALTGDAEPCVKTVSVAGPPLPGRGDVLVFPQEYPLSLLLAVPQADACWAGSLTTEYDGDGDAVYATGPEVSALVKALQIALPGLDSAAVSRAQAAVQVRAAPGEEVRDPAASGGRCDGFLSVSGAGVTRFRRVAEEAVDLACRKLGRALSVPPCRTASALLPPVPAFAGDMVPAAVEYAIAEEDCLTLRDFLERRAPLSWTAVERQANAPDALAALADQLGWDTDRQAAEVKAWNAELALGQAFRVL
jgi:glycerol-3-phosphate dehydrogenase